MLLGRRVDGRRAFVLGVAGLVPAALVTLLIVHQPSIGARRLYPMLRGSLSVVGLGLALASLFAWTIGRNRLSRSALTGLAWAGVTVLLCVGPFLENAPRTRLYAFDLDTEEVVWATNRYDGAPELVDGELVVVDEAARELVGLDPGTGRERWRRARADDEVPRREIASPWAGLVLAGEEVLAAARWGERAYAYVSSRGADGTYSGAVVQFRVDDGTIGWRRPLPEPLAVQDGTPAMAVNSDSVVVAGGERMGVLDADDGDLRWTQSVVSLGRSRSYALPGAVQQVVVSDSLVFLSATPGG